MLTLQPNEYASAADLYAPLEYQLATQAVLAGTAEGRVFVDRLPFPRLGVLQTGHRLYLSGDSADETARAQARALIRETLLVEAAQHGEDGFILYFHDPGWQLALLEQVFAGHKVYYGPRQYYELDGLKSGWQPPVDPPLPDGLALVQDLGAYVEREGLEGREALLEEMTSERASVADFLRHSFGTCFTNGSANLGWCLSEYNLGARCEVGIATDEAYRRQGLATTMGVAFIRQAIACGVTRVGWHCWTGNSGSVMTARKLGMALKNEHGAFYVPCSSNNS